VEQIENAVKNPKIVSAGILTYSKLESGKREVTVNNDLLRNNHSLATLSNHKEAWEKLREIGIT